MNYHLWKAVERGEMCKEPMAEVLQAYIQRRRGGTRRPHGEDLTNKVLDEVHPEVVGRVKVMELYAEAPKFARRGISFIKCVQRQPTPAEAERGIRRAVEEQPRPPKGAACPALAGPVATAAAVARRGQPSQTCFLDPGMSARAGGELTRCGMWSAVDDATMEARCQQLMDMWRTRGDAATQQALAEWRRLLEHDPPGDKQDGFPTARCHLFLVEKPGKIPPVYRIICDARAANARTRESSTFPLFTLDALRQEVSNVMQAAKAVQRPWYAVNVDLRHWFHQLPCPHWLSTLFTVRLANGQRLATNSCPMGFSLSPLIGQSCTLALLLGSEDGENGLDPGLAAINTNSEGMPPWIPLGVDAEGVTKGAIFVILDNIFVVTPDRELAERWSQRIRDRAERYDILLKGDNPTQIIEMAPDTATTTVFLGIEFKYDRWRVSPKGHRPAFPRGRGKQHWTYRLLAALLGECMWDMRVRGVLFADVAEFMRLYRLSTPPGAQNWDSAVELPAEDYTRLERQVAEAREHRECAALPRWRCPSDAVQFWACDAAGSRADGRETYVASVSLSAVICQAAEVPRAWGANLSPGCDIAVRELAGIVECVQRALAPSAMPVATQMIVIACDSQVAIAWAERRYSDNPLALELLGRLNRVLEEGAARLGLLYIKSDDNFADLPSRATESEFCPETREWKPGPEIDGSREYRQRLGATKALLRGSVEAILSASIQTGTVTQAGKAVRRARGEDS